MRSSWILVFLLAAACHQTGLAVSDGGAADSGTSDSGSTCAGLDETACVANAACTADYCLQGSCASTFIGCRVPSAAQTQCPAVGGSPPLCCSSANTCTAPYICFEPGQTGGAQLGCTKDSDCVADGEVCVSGQCGGPTCNNGACPPNFACESGLCARDGCKADTDCAAENFCVNSHCYRDSGTCGQGVP